MSSCSVAPCSSSRSLVALFLASSHPERVLVALAALCLASSAHAAEITPHIGVDGISSVWISGTLEAADVDKFRKTVDAIPGDRDRILVILDSPGGTSAALSIGVDIHRSGISTLVPPGKICNSVCAYIWLAGRVRLASQTSSIGFHGFYDAATGEPTQEAMVESARLGRISPTLA